MRRDLIMQYDVIFYDNMRCIISDPLRPLRYKRCWWMKTNEMELRIDINQLTSEND